MIHKLVVMFSLLAFISVVLMGAKLTYTLFKADQADYINSSKCAAHYVSQGIERRDIIIEGGSCRVKPY
jgi:hypothetical protein